MGQRAERNDEGDEVSGYTGLVEETPEQMTEWKSQQIWLPPCAGKEVEETLFDEPPKFMRVENQQRTNMCAAHAGTSCIEKLEYMLTGVMIQRSRNYVYAKAQHYCGLYGDQGVTLGSIIKALKINGAPPEEMYPFTGTFNPRIPKGCDEEAAKCRVTATIDVESGGYDAVRTVCGQNIGAVLFATSWPIGYSNGYIVERYIPFGRFGHARAWIVLSSRKDSLGRPYVWAVNSHSEDAQYMGYELWSPTAIQESIDEGRWGNTGVTSMTTPEPQEVDWKGELNPFRFK